jgi:hypothetical protein
VGPRAVLDTVVKRKIPRPRRESNPRTSIIQPVVVKNTDASGKQKFRLVVYRKLIQKTIGDVYPLPDITEILDQLGQAKYFTCVGKAVGCHQIEMDPKDVDKTAFSTKQGHSAYRRMPLVSEQRQPGFNG